MQYSALTDGVPGRETYSLGFSRAIAVEGFQAKGRGSAKSNLARLCGLTATWPQIPQNVLTNGNASRAPTGQARQNTNTSSLLHGAPSASVTL